MQLVNQKPSWTSLPLPVRVPGSPVARIPYSSFTETYLFSCMVPTRNCASTAHNPRGRDSFSLCAATCITYEVSKLRDNCYSSGLESTKRLTVRISEEAWKHLSYGLSIINFFYGFLKQMNTLCCPPTLNFFRITHLPSPVV